jgi:hypothetical protein
MSGDDAIRERIGRLGAVESREAKAAFERVLAMASRRARRRRAARGAALALMAVGTLASLPWTLHGILNLRGGHPINPVHPSPSSLPAATGPAGALVPAYLPPNFKLTGLDEFSLSRVPEDDAYFRSFGRYTSDRSDLSADFAITMMRWSPPLDVDAEVSRYPEAHRLTIRGHEALFLPHDRWREGSTLAWMERDGLLLQVVGAGVSDSDILAVAEGLRVGSSDPQQGGTFEATYVPVGFEPLKGRGHITSDPGQPPSVLVAGPVPRAYVQTFARHTKEEAVRLGLHGVGPTVTVTVAYERLPDPHPAGRTVAVGGQEAEFYLGDDGELILEWIQGEVTITVIGVQVSENDVIAVARSLGPS